MDNLVQLRLERLLDRKNELVTIVEDSYSCLGMAAKLRSHKIPYLLAGSGSCLSIKVAPEDEMSARYALNLIVDKEESCQN